MFLSTSLSLIRQASEMGVAACIAYPRQGDVSLEPDRYAQLFSSAKSLRMQTKTTPACVNPDDLVPLFSYLDQFTISIDGFEERFSVKKASAPP